MERNESRPIKTRRQLARAARQRAANRQAVASGEPLPYPNPWDAVDPTKVSRGATVEELAASYEAFCELCRPQSRIEYTLQPRASANVTMSG